MAKFSEILDAYEACNFGEPIDAQAFVCLNDGAVYIQSSELGFDDVLPEGVSADECIEIPNKHELGLGRELAIAFSEAAFPNAVGSVIDFFKRPGAYSNFKSLLARNGKLQAWYDYEASAKESRLREWCRCNGIELQ